MAEMQIQKVASTNSLRACRRFLSQNPIANVLPLGDLNSPLMQVSDVYSAIDSKRVVGVCTVYRAFPTSSIVLGATTRRIKEALLKTALPEISSNFISLCQPKDVDMFKKYSTILYYHPEIEEDEI